MISQQFNMIAYHMRPWIHMDSIFPPSQTELYTVDNRKQKQKKKNSRKE